MPEMLLINPRKRTRRAAPKKRRTSAKRRRNPIMNAAANPRRRRRNPITLRKATRRTVRRRRNPISLGGSARGIMGKLTDALLGGAGAVGVDVLMGQIAPFLPASLKRVPGKVGIGDAVKVGITVLAGELLNKPTRGASRKMAAGALTVQAAEILRSFVPPALTLGEFGYAVPAVTAWGLPNAAPNNFSAYTGPDGTPLLAGDDSDTLDAYVSGSGMGTGSPLLSAAGDEYGENGQFLG